MKKAVILLGAGFAIPWRGPSSGCLLNRLKCYPYDKLFTDSIIQKLTDYYESNDINFETYIACIESLQNYIFSKTIRDGKSPLFNSLLPAIYGINIDLLNIIKKNESTNNVSERVYIANVLKHTISTILERIICYDNPESIENYSALNEHLITFVESLIGRDYKVKFYTTNYDRLIPYIFHKYKLNEGLSEAIPPNNRDKFDLGTNTSSIEDFCKLEMTPNTVVESLDPKPIDFQYNLSEFCSSDFSHFNLHGSRYIGLSNEIPYRPVFFPSGNHYFSDISINIEGGNPNDNLLFSPIIVGYSKTQRVFSEPFSFGFNAFSFDCDTCDKFFSFGYSFRDPHINNIIQTNLKSNVVLDCIVKDNTFTSSLHLPTRLHYLSEKENGYCESHDRMTHVFNTGIENYLQKQLYLK